MSNPVSSVDVPLSIFGSWDTELSPPDIPEGGSPANSDVVYTPGAVATRPGLNRIFAVPIDVLGPFSYEKSYILPNGNIQNLYLTMMDGILWMEDVTNNPGMATQIFQSCASYASSCTAQGREYIALSDGQHGADIPLIWDGQNLSRLTQDGPGAPPTVVSVALPSATLAVSGGGGATITSITTSGFTGSVYLSITITCNDTSAFFVGIPTTIASNTQSAFNKDFTVTSISSPTVFVCSYFGAALLTGTGGTASVGGATLIRSGNTVTATTATAHGLQRGYQTQIQNAGTSFIGGGIATIVLNNEDTPGLATVTTNTPHGLLPNNQITIAGVNGATVGTGITNVAFAGNFVTITTSAAHGLAISSEVIVAAVTNTTVNGQWVVAATPTATTFTYAFVSIVTAYSAGDTGAVSYLWPLASVDPALDYFTVQTAPTATTFTIALSYTDGSWTGGTISFQWDGIFSVTAILSSTSFQYQQYGPPAKTTTAGTETPYGQMAPGIHQVRLSGLLADGTITPPSPPATFVANGGQYASITNILIGPSNWVGRILQFTGAGGAYFYYIPVPAQVNGLIVSTATQINDNLTTSIIMDFSDNTLYAATSVSKPGNNLAALLVVNETAGMFSYASRLQTWGGRQKVQNFLNMGFDGAYNLALGMGMVPGWTMDPLSANGVLFPSPARPPGFTWLISCSNDALLHGEIHQSAYVDTFGAPILLPNQAYNIRVWLQPGAIDGTQPYFEVIVSSPSTGFAATAQFPNFTMNLNGSFLEMPLSSSMPATIPSDLKVTIYGAGATSISTILVDDLQFIYADVPYLQNEEFISYAGNLSAFDANTGILGPEDDLSPIMNHLVIRQALYIVTGTGLHETADNGQTEPSEWNVDQVADNCGAFSIASVARNPQGIGSSGKDWGMWSGPDGAQIFAGQKPLKVSQEIQSIWDAVPASQQFQCWVKNYESAKWCFFGIPTTGSSMEVLVLDYRNIDGAAIAENPPIHISFTGKMIVSDLTRKWTVWTVPAWCGELMYRANISQPQIVFGCLTPSGAANAYTLNAAQYNDDDYGVIPASYTTYFFVSHEMEQALQVGSHRHIYTLAQAFISGVGTWSLTPLAAAVSNAFPTSDQYPLTLDPYFDIDFGINVNTTRCAFRIQASPTDGLNSYFKLQKLVINIAKDPNSPVRGSAYGSY